MNPELDPPIAPQVMTAVKMFGLVILLWLVGSITVHALLWYRVLPDLRAVPRSCGPGAGETTLPATQPEAPPPTPKP